VDEVGQDLQWFWMGQKIQTLFLTLMASNSSLI
jgi:hypothetical protein